MGILDKFFRKKREEKESLWTKCPECKTILYIPELSANLKVCPKCNYHFPMNAKERVESLLDGDVEVLFENILPKDPLGFKDTKSYKDRIRQAQDETGMSEAILVVRGRLRDIPMVLTVMDFSFIGGSMGSVVGERFYRACKLSASQNLPLVSVITSGGARMQEGILSLMQMAKTSIGVGLLEEKGLPYITVLTDPTMGGVSASFAFLGDIILAEPRSLIGFAGPRVIEQTIKQQLPEGFQRSEFLLEKGMLDMVVHRKELKDVLYRLLKMSTHGGRYVGI
ncbi:acetyl-CoA carboxylase, carboxyl transferase, beta subunit [Hydrogenobacter thermophilus TK-6]|uniref:Acetyl-coenzyme A carboxylase carboxyl transferase subunit beta n=1 Tax=Hydrogenobacter thermophilus (strain DSM 6534 / IAM 12695 / TK-6) TaxID=608538 RepID=D3DJR9_HYDTT|nr:acetyl-CoA carboxylase, carboxyltransferase subunit beta [Hydrogenobacter thermophilus]ADO45994.1 acetyl-CoA carboxylase, carboxyl transferase, beta subunit [Hydrogenobacter thermophilus TK-6]BAI70071.1 acetyl-CoA carboxyltransferase beta subunit [Hydrogenobacter thermophilus TK-6]